VAQALRLPDLAGWSVSGRNGHMGIVVSDEAYEARPADLEARRLLVCGGTTHALYFHVPIELITTVAQGRCALKIDADVSDFMAHLRPDGSVDLFPR
jgi:hypothetical protein